MKKEVGRLARKNMNLAKGKWAHALTRHHLQVLRSLTEDYGLAVLLVIFFLTGRGTSPMPAFFAWQHAVAAMALGSSRFATSVTRLLVVGSSKQRSTNPLVLKVSLVTVTLTRPMSPPLSMGQRCGLRKRGRSTEPCARLTESACAPPRNWGRSPAIMVQRRIMFPRRSTPATVQAMASPVCGINSVC
jgi:hypothetical protein